jgi:hypothetical protein
MKPPCGELAEDDGITHSIFFRILLCACTAFFYRKFADNRHPPTNEMFFVQNAGARAAGTGLNKSAIVQRISVSEADKYKASSSAVGKVAVERVDANPPVINPNGGTNWRGKIVFCGEGQGETVPSALYLMEPEAPYNTTGELT